MGKKQIDKTLKIFVERAKRQFQAQQVVLFGSYARGEAKDYSDIDCIVIAESFKKIPQEKRIDLLYPLIQDLYLIFMYLDIRLRNSLTPTRFQRLQK